MKHLREYIVENTEIIYEEEKGKFPSDGRFT